MQVFISHSPETNGLAQKVGEALKRAGYGVWSDQEILPGDNWAEKLAQALEQSQAMVVLLTPAALSSASVRREIDFALGRKSFKNRLIPVLVGPEDEIAFEGLPWILYYLNVIKLPVHGKEEEGINQITRALQAVT